MKTYKCKHCWTRNPEDSEIITQGIYRYCTKSCSRSHTAEINAKKKEKEKVKKQKARTKKQNSVTVLKTKLWKIVSEYIRLRDSDDDNFCLCVTCPPWTERRHYKDSIQAGHYIASWQSSFHRYNEKNIHSQCYGCNVGKWGNVLEYQKFMEKKYWKEYTDWLFESRNEMTLLGAMELKELIEQYQVKLSDVKSRKAID